MKTDNLCDICPFRRDIYCQHPKATKYALTGLFKTPRECPEIKKQEIKC